MSGYFFFQAEDGIRGDLVTGVQTCALPIWFRPLIKRSRPAPRAPVLAPRFEGPPLAAPPSARAPRSEERRVGKECRCWGWAWHIKKRSAGANHSPEARARADSSEAQCA